MLGADQEQLTNVASKRNWKPWSILSVVALAAATLVGCAGKYTGSGSIPSVTGDPNRATIAFNVQTDGSENFKGQIQFQDRAAGVRVHGEITSSVVLPEGPVFIDGEIWPAGTIVMEGTYTSQPPAVGGGIFNIAAYSPQTPGNKGGGEQLLVILYGAEDTYYNFGHVSGGNVTFHKTK